MVAATPVHTPSNSVLGGVSDAAEIITGARNSIEKGFSSPPVR